MLFRSHVLPQSSTSSFSIRPINLQPTANQASHRISSHLQTHHTHKPKPRSPSSDHRFATSNLYNPETAPHLPWVSSSPWPQITHHAHHTHKHRTEVELELLPQTTHMQPLQPRNGAQFAVALIRSMAHQLRRCSSKPAQRYLINKFN